MDPNLVRDWDEIRDKEIREREKEKKEEEDKLKKKSISRSPVKHHKIEKPRQEHKPSPEKNHKDMDKKDKGKRKKKKDADVDKKKKKKSRDKKEKDDFKKGDDKEDESNDGDIKLETEMTDQGNQEPAAPGTSESPPPFECFESVTTKENNKVKHENVQIGYEENVTNALYGDLDEETPVDTSWGSLKSSENVETSSKSTEESIEDKPKEPEVLAELPERSKWEVEEDISTTDDKFDVDKLKEEHVMDNLELQNDNCQVSVTNEVLKRAENAIFQKTVRTLDVSGKKTVGDKCDSIKDKKSDQVRDKKIESEKYLNKDKKLDGLKDKNDVLKEKKVENGKDKKVDANKDKKADNIKDKKQDIIKDRISDMKDFKVKKSDIDKDKKPDLKDRKLDIIKNKKLDRERRRESSNDKSEIKIGSDKSSRRDDYSLKHKDKKYLDSEAALDSLLIQREARKSGNSIQITIPTDTLDDKKTKEVTKRISAKERLGDKVEDKDDKHYKSRSEKNKSSRSPVRVHSTLIVPEPLPRKIRTTSKGCRDLLKKERNSKNESNTSTHRVSRREDDKNLDHQLKKSELRRVVRVDDKHRRAMELKSVSKRDDQLDKKDDRRKEEKREDMVKRSKPIEKEPEKKERKNRRLEPDRKVSDQTTFEDDDDSKKIFKDKESEDSESSSSSSSSSSDSSPVRSKKRKKTKKRKKKHLKKKKLASSSDSEDSESSSESDETSSKHKKKKKREQRKHKTHKKAIKKKKKTKHR